MVLARRLSDRADADHRFAIASKKGAVFLDPELDPGDVAQANEVPVVALGYDEPSEAFDVGEAPLDAGLETLRVRLERACGQLDVLGSERARSTSLTVSSRAAKA